jgi:hypothetical protein
MHDNFNNYHNYYSIPIVQLNKSLHTYNEEGSAFCKNNSHIINYLIPHT